VGYVRESAAMPLRSPYCADARRHSAPPLLEKIAIVLDHIDHACDVTPDPTVGALASRRERPADGGFAFAGAAARPVSTG